MMIKWKMLPARFQGAGIYNFGALKVSVDSDGYFETNGLPPEPLYAIAKRLWECEMPLPQRIPTKQAAE